jgi:DNA-binding transcriptional LysR family regulator
MTVLKILRCCEPIENVPMSFDTRLLSGVPLIAAIVNAGTFTGAGKALGLSQSGVSRAIQQLEERLGIRLFDRNTKVLRLTDAGKRFYNEIAPLITRFEEAAEEAVQTNAKLRGRLRINVDPMVFRLIIVPQLRTFREANPDLQLEFLIQNQFGNLITDGFDAVVRFGHPQPSSLIARRLLQVRVSTCASPSYLINHAHPRNPEELATKTHECLLFLDSIKGTSFPWEFHRGKEILTVPVSGHVTFNDGLAYLDACLAGMGVAQLFHLGLDPLLSEGKLINLFPDWSDEVFPLYVYHTFRQFIPARLRIFLNFLETAISERPIK